MASEYKWRNQGGAEDDEGTGVGSLGPPRAAALPPLREDADKENKPKRSRRRRDKDGADGDDGSSVTGSVAGSRAGSVAGDDPERDGLASARSGRGAGGVGGLNAGATRKPSGAGASDAGSAPRRRSGKTRASAKLEGGDGSDAESRRDEEGSLGGSDAGGAQESARQRGNVDDDGGDEGGGGTARSGAVNSRKGKKGQEGAAKQDKGLAPPPAGGKDSSVVIGRRMPDRINLPTVEEGDLANDKEELVVRVGGEGIDDDEADHGNNILYVETGTGRAFKRKKKDKDGEKEPAPSDRVSDTDQNLKAFLDSIAAFAASSFIFAQGVLGGCCLLLFHLSVNNSDTDFMRVYSPIAADSQKAFLFLSTVSIVAAMDKWTKDHMAAWHLRGGYLKAVDAMTIFWYLLCFIFTLICTPLEDVMYASHLRVSEWYRWELSADFLAHYATWRATHVARCVFGILGWIFSSLETRNYLNNAPNKPMHDIYQKLFGKSASTAGN